VIRKTSCERAPPSSSCTSPSSWSRTLALTAMGIDFITALSGVAATLGIVGPGLGQLGPTQNYASMPDLAKVIFAFDMYAGRLDLWTVLILLRPAFWREP